MPISPVLDPIVALARAGELDAASTLCKRQLALTPEDAETWHLSALLQMLSGHPKPAVEGYRRAITLDPTVAKYHSNLANALLACQDPVAAEHHYRRALTLASPPPETHYNLALLLSRQDRKEEAETVLTEASRLATLDADAYTLLGNCQQKNGRVVQACSSYQRALGLNPGDADTRAELSLMQEALNQLVDAATSARQVLTRIPDHPLASFVEARLLRRAGKLEEALARLAALPPDALPGPLAAAARNEEGQILDRLDRTDAAFACFISAKQIQLRHAPERLASQAQAYLGEVTRLLSQEDSYASTLTPPQPDEPRPVFLVGFPRSGTTLLETMLGGHPGIQTLEERPLIQTLVASHPELFTGVAARSPLPTTTRRFLQALYFDLAAQDTPRQSDTLWLDKLPLNLVRIPSILRIFPSARFILALRHPCDVCLSCQMQLFALNPAMAQLSTLDSTVHFYALTMQLWQRYARELPLKVYPIRYEEIVRSPETELARLLDFLDLPWHDNVSRFTQRARDGRHIDTPSYQQVSQALYHHADGRWQRYRTHLDAHLPILRPAMHAFGYTG